MTSDGPGAPRVEVRLDRIAHNARTITDRLRHLGIGVCGVTKSTLGSTVVARTLLDSGVTSLGESRVDNVERLRRGGIEAEILLIRSPMPSQVERVVAAADVSLNSEVDVVTLLSTAAVRQRRRHGVVLMVELGDLREGLMAGDVHEAVRHVLDLPGVVLRGIGTNLACQNGIAPDAANMAELSALATSVEAKFGVHLDIVSGGNSANLGWVLDPGAEVGRVNHLRLGESLLLGREPLSRTAIPGLHTDAVAIVGEIIESKRKPSRPWGRVEQTAFGDADAGRVDEIVEGRCRVLIALGRQDVDPSGLVPPEGFRILGASSDHLVLDAPSGMHPEVGAEVRFDVNYSALLGAMTSPFVERAFLTS